MDKLKKAKEIIKENYELAHCGIYNNENIVGDATNTFYECDGLKIDVCLAWSYFEVFGLTDDEFKELKEFYDSLEKEMG